MKFVRNFAVGLVLILVAGACKNDLNLNAPYKEIPSIYAVVNPQEKIQMIRINKVFLGEGDANKMAKVADSVNYQAGDITVTLERYFGDSRIQATPDSIADPMTISFHDSVITTNPGAFNTTQRVYVTSQKLYTTGVYKLIVKNNKTGNVFTAKATAIDSVDVGADIVWPLTIPPHAPVYTFPTGFPQGTPDKEYVDYIGRDGSVMFRPNDAKYGKVYTLVIRNHYYDIIGWHSYDYVDYVFGNKFSKDAKVLSGIPYISYNFKPADYFTAVGAALAQKKVAMNVSGRRLYMVEFLVYTSTQEYLDYLEYAKPSLSLNQNKPLYSNFDNQAALGIFTFRTRCSVKKDVLYTFVNEFAFNKNTCQYLFVRSDSDTWQGCQ